jgi:hypothetical protein
LIAKAKGISNQTAFRIKQDQRPAGCVGDMGSVNRDSIKSPRAK